MFGASQNVIPVPHYFAYPEKLDHTEGTLREEFKLCNQTILRILWMYK